MFKSSVITSILAIVCLCLAHSQSFEDEVRTSLKQFEDENLKIQLRLQLIEATTRSLENLSRTILSKINELHDKLNQTLTVTLDKPTKEKRTWKLCETVNDAGNCERDRDNADLIWTVVQRRLPVEEPENFDRLWDEYKNGFGSFDSEFWIGNDALHQLTSQNVTLRIEMIDVNGRLYIAEYDKFGVASEKFKYRLTLSGYSGNATDSFGKHNGYFFSTVDNDNDGSDGSCAKTYKTGWWFNNCHEVNLNGMHKSKFDISSKTETAINWWYVDSVENRMLILSKVKMMIRKKNLPEEDEE